MKSVSKFLLDRSNASTNADNNSSTDDFEAELAKITKGKQKVNSERKKMQTAIWVDQFWCSIPILKTSFSRDMFFINDTVEGGHSLEVPLLL